MEEKFQGGTGVNITPPPKEIVPPPLLTETKTRMERVAKTLGIQNYTRIDFFLNVTNGRIIVIEANTLPGLTPSTVIYHQALAETPPQTPREFLEGIIRDAKDGQQPIRIYNEIGIGNQWFICHEREQGEHESRHKGFAKIKIEAVYLRFWIGKKSMVISTNDGITFKRRSRNEFKVLFGYSGQPSDKI